MTPSTPRNAVAVFAAVSLLLTPRLLCAQSPSPQPLGAAIRPEQVGFDSQRLKRLSDFMADQVAKKHVVGIATLLARHGRIVAFDTYGASDLASGKPLQKDAIFRIYSMTKPVTGVAMMILFEEGRWRLDDPVTRYVPEFKTLRVMTGVDNSGKILTEPMKRPPTMREIMSHTAGFGYGLGEVSPVDKLYREKRVMGSKGLHQMIERIADIPLMFQPGADWSYSSAVDIQGYIIEKLSGETLGQFLDEHIFKPLKMDDTAFYVHPGKEGRLSSLYTFVPETESVVPAKDLFGSPTADYTKPPAMESGGGGLTSTTHDYARFCQMILNKGELDGAQILSPASVELMDTNAIPQNLLVSSNGSTTVSFNEAVGFGLDFMVVTDPRRAGLLEGKNTMSWAGAAGTWFWIDPTNDLFFVGMIQRLGENSDVDLGTASRTLTYQALIHPEK